MNNTRERRQTIKRSIIIIISIFILLFFTSVLINQLEYYYTMSGTISNINNNTNVITIEDITGNLWTIEDTVNNYHINDNVKIKFYNNLTDTNRLDDIIEKVTIVNMK